MKKRILSLLLALVLCLSIAPAALAASSAANGSWNAKSITLKGTAEAELSVRVGDIDALNEPDVEGIGYDPFTAKDQYAHSYPWPKDDSDPAGTDRIFVGSHWDGETCADGYAGEYYYYSINDDKENAYGDGALTLTMNYDASGIVVRNALLQLCIDDFQAVSWGSKFTVTLNGKDAPFVAELLNHVDQTGPTSYIVSAIIPASFFPDIRSGRLEIVIDELTGIGDGFAVDFAKLLVNYSESVFTGTFTGHTEPGATVRLLGTSTTVKASQSGFFEFKAVPGLNAVRADKKGFQEGYDFGIVLSSGTEWEAYVDLYEGTAAPDIDFSQFAATEAWSKADGWALPYLTDAQALNLIPDCLLDADMTLPISRAEFAAVAVKVYESLSGKKAVAGAAFADCTDAEVRKAVAIGITNGTDAAKNLFSPNETVSREQAATMLTRAFKACTFTGWTLSTDSNYSKQFKALFTMPKLFDDDSTINGYAKDSVYFMAANEIINGIGYYDTGDGIMYNAFLPRNRIYRQQAEALGLATREQAMKIAVCMIQNLK